MAISKMTKTEAVNRMLEAIGESPVASLTVSGVDDVSKAITTLDRESRSLQARGWWFNKDYDVPLEPDSNNHILVSGEVLRVDPKYPNQDYVERAGKLWDRTNRTFTITETTYCHVTYGFEFDDLPDSARRYITEIAARVFQKQVLGADFVDKELQEEELKAKVIFLQEDSDNAHRNILHGYEIAGTVNRLWNPNRNSRY